jgi:hypothetical protein
VLDVVDCVDGRVVFRMLGGFLCGRSLSGGFFWGWALLSPNLRCHLAASRISCVNAMNVDTFIDGTLLAEKWLLAWKQFLKQCP